MAADKERLKAVQSVREFGAIEKQLESPIKRAEQRQLVKDRQALASQLNKRDSGGLIVDRLRSVAKESRTNEHSRGGLEL